MEPIEFPTNRTGMAGAPSPSGTEPASEGASFGDIIRQSMAEVNRLQKVADDAVRELSTGQNRDVHGTLIALEKADISFKLLMQVRNKLIAAYNEIMRLQI